MCFFLIHPPIGPSPHRRASKKVQTFWSRLEPIFMQSDDIRSQLPEDSKRFEALDNAWKELMMEARPQAMSGDGASGNGKQTV